MLSLRAINQFYGQNHILWDVDMDLMPGTCTAVLGQPGMGKPPWLTALWVICQSTAARSPGRRRTPRQKI